MGVRVRLPRCGRGAQVVEVAGAGPNGAENQDRSPCGIGQECAKTGGDLLAVLAMQQVVVGLIEPDHGLGAHLVESVQSGCGPIRVDWVPQSPVTRQVSDGLEARPGLACGRRTNQQGKATCTVRGVSNELAQLDVMGTFHIGGQSAGATHSDRAVNLEIVWIDVVDGTPKWLGELRLRP
ncbi:hypothetical protein STPH1_1578 [Streptomyces sp. OM5714]|nr:hypothetical protein STPH1_1578 [Streptomyces sp. OM5714]